MSKQVYITLWGAFDFYSMLVPKDSRYLDIRPRIGIEQENTFPLTDNYSMNVRANDIKKYWDNGELAIVNCAGCLQSERSHFETIRMVSTGQEDANASNEGFLSKVITRLNPETEPNLLSTIVLHSYVPLIVKGSHPVANVALRDDLNFRESDQLLDPIFGDMYRGFEGELSDIYVKGLASREEIANLIDSSNVASTILPEDQDFIKQCKIGGALLASSEDTKILSIDIKGNDTHSDQRIFVDQRIEMLSQGINALITNLGDAFEDTTIIVMTEFGRELAENGKFGTDHGYGTPYFIFSKKVNGGVYNDELSIDFFGGRFAPVTTDYREIISRLLEIDFNFTGEDLDYVFEGYNNNIGSLNLA